VLTVWVATRRGTAQRDQRRAAYDGDAVACHGSGRGGY
jgi:hypothetical protein